MNRIPLCLLLASLAYPASGQSPIFFRGSAPQYDMEKHPPTGEKLVPFSTADAAANTANWNAINDKIHMATGGIREDVTLPAGRWYHNGTLRIGINAAETQVRAGGCITGAGGWGSQLNSNSTSINLGTETRIINTSSIPSGDGYTDGASLLYGGSGWTFGNCAVYGFDLPNNDAWVARNSATKQEVGLRLQASAVAGVANASYLWCPPITFMGFRDAILSQPKTGTNGQANNTYWQFIAADTCETIFHVNDQQSVMHEIYALVPGEYCDRGIFMELGGHIHVHSMEVTYPNFLVAEIGDESYHHTHGELVIDGLKLDNNASAGIVLLKMGAQLFDERRAVSISGTVGANVGFAAAGACQGIEPDDKVFINFTGDPAKAALLNDYSTVDAEGNYRATSHSLQVTPQGSNLTTGDGKAYFRMPEELDGWRLYRVDASLDVASSSGAPTFQVRRKRGGSDVDMFTTRVSIDVNETDTDDAAVQQAINASNDDVQEGDRLYFDCDIAGTGAQSFQAHLTFRRW